MDRKSVRWASDKSLGWKLPHDLKNCEIILKATCRLAQINNKDRLIKIQEKVPAFLKSQWQTKVQEIQNKGRDLNIEDVRKLVRTADKQKNDPLLVAMVL